MSLLPTAPAASEAVLLSKGQPGLWSNWSLIHSEIDIEEILVLPLPVLLPDVGFSPKLKFTSEIEFSVSASDSVHSDWLSLE